MYHVKAGPHPSSSSLTHTHIHLPPWLVDLDEHWSDAIGGGGGRSRREREGGRGKMDREEGGKEIEQRGRTEGGGISLYTKCHPTP